MGPAALCPSLCPPASPTPQPSRQGTPPKKRRTPIIFTSGHSPQSQKEGAAQESLGAGARVQACAAPPKLPACSWGSCPRDRELRAHPSAFAGGRGGARRPSGPRGGCWETPTRAAGFVQLLSEGRLATGLGGAGPRASGNAPSPEPHVAQPGGTGWRMLWTAGGRRLSRCSEGRLLAFAQQELSRWPRPPRGRRAGPALA